MIMCYNFFVGMCSRCIELIQIVCYNIILIFKGGFRCPTKDRLLKELEEMREEER